MKTIIFIIGAGHSGSTLLAKTLNAHSKVFALSEISQFYEDMQNENAHCGCGKLLRKCNFWEEINVLLREKLDFGIKDKPNEFVISRDSKKNNILDKINFKLSRLFATFAFYNKHFLTRLNHIKILFDVLFNKTGAEVLVDSSKSAKRAYLLKKYLLKNGYQIRVIHLVRDGRAVLYSYLKGYYKVKLKNPDTGEYEMKTFYSDKKRSKEEILKIWKRDNYESLFYHKLINKNSYFFLRYEDFANDPIHSLEKLFEFLGLNFEEEMLNLNRFENHMVSGNASRINAEKILTPFDSWKQKLLKEQLEYFTKKGSKLNKKFGYEQNE